MRNLGNERVVRVGVGQHRTDRQQHCIATNNKCKTTTISRCPRQEHAQRPQATAVLTLADGQSRTPLIPQNVQTDRPVRVDVRVVDSSGKADFGGLEGVVYEYPIVYHFIRLALCQ